MRNWIKNTWKVFKEVKYTDGSFIIHYKEGNKDIKITQKDLGTLNIIKTFLGDNGQLTVSDDNYPYESIKELTVDESIAELEEMLQEAISSDNFEEAIDLRDEISVLKLKLKEEEKEN